MHVPLCNFQLIPPQSIYLNSMRDLAAGVSKSPGSLGLSPYLPEAYIDGQSHPQLST